jgi:tetratricopeptide (TPR) repeat protein
MDGAGDDIRVSLQIVDADGRHLVGGVSVPGRRDDLRSLADALVEGVSHRLDLEFQRTYGYVDYGSSDSAMSGSDELAAVKGAMRTLDGALQLRTTARLVDAFPDEHDAWVLRIQAWARNIEDDPSVVMLDGLDASAAKLRVLDPQSPYVTLARAIGHRARGARETAIVELGRILARDDLAPRLRAWVLRLRSQGLAVLGRSAEALEDGAAAIRLDPTNVWGYASLSVAMLEADRFDDALRLARKAAALRPESAVTHRCVAAALAAQGRWEEAVPVLEVAREGQGNAQDEHALLALAYRHVGDANHADEARREADSRTDTPGGTVYLAREAALDDRPDDALRFLRRGMDVGLAGTGFASAREFRDLMADPEFEAIVSAARVRVGEHD